MRNKITGYLSCPEFDTTKKINQLITESGQTLLCFVDHKRCDRQPRIPNRAGQLGPCFKCDNIRFPLFPTKVLFLLTLEIHIYAIGLFQNVEYPIQI